MLYQQVISLRIAGKYGGETQEIVLHSGPESENKTTSVSSNTDSNINPVPGPSNAASISSALQNVAQIIAAGKY